MAPKGKKKAAAAASTSQDKPAGETALGDKPYMGFGQYAGEGPMFFVKQFSGLVVAAIGVLIMVSSYSEDYNFVPLDPTGTMWVALVIMMIGLGLHELRPWKRLEFVRSRIEGEGQDAQAEQTAANPGTNGSKKTR